MKLIIRPITINEIRNLVELHLDAFKGFFLSELGKDFLFAYYDSLRKNDRTILKGCFEENVLLGFYAATTLSSGFNSYLVKKNFSRFVTAGVVLLFRRPGGLLRLLKNFTKSDSLASDNGDYAELLSIGVARSAQGKGVGKLLLFDLEKVLIERKVERLSLTTDFNDNNNTLKFYKSMNYEIMYEFIAFPKRKMYRLIKNL